MFSLRRKATAVVASAALMGGAALLASAGPASATTSAPPLSVSLYATSDSTAAWNAAGDPVLTAGTDAGTSAQLVLNLGNGPAPATAPSFAASTSGSGDPHWDMQLLNGCSLSGEPGTSSTGWSANPGGPQGVSYTTALQWAQTCSKGDNYMGSLAIVDDATGHSLGPVTLTDINYNGLGLAPVTSTASGPIRNVNSGKCLDVRNGDYSATGVLQQWSCGATYNGGSDQQFIIVNYPDGSAQLQAIASPGTSTWCVTGSTVGAQLTLAACTDPGTTVAKVGPFYYLGAKSSNRVMDVRLQSTANGAVVQDYTYNGGTNQQWSMP